MRRRLMFVALIGLVALLVIATFGAAQGKALKPKNAPVKKNQTLGEKYGATPSNDCWLHHKGEGMRDAFIVFPIIPKEIPVGKATEIEVQVINPWKQRVQDISMDVALIGNEQILSVEASSAGSGGAPNDDVHLQYIDKLGVPAGSSVPAAARKYPHNATHKFAMPAGAVSFYFRVEFVPHGGVPSQVPNQEDEWFASLNLEPASTDDSNKQVYIAYENRTRLVHEFVYLPRGAANMSIRVAHQRGPASETEVYINGTIVMGGGSTAKKYTIKTDPNAQIPKGGAPYSAKFTVIPFKEGRQQMEIHVRAGNYYRHQDPSTPTLDHYNRYANLSAETDTITGDVIIAARSIAVGKAFVPSPFGGAVAETVSDEWQFVLAETSGFGAAALLVPSLLLGGTYGKGSRRFFNGVLGGAKRRVMYHNLVSLGLSLVALVHIVLFMVEVRYTIKLGVLWGGLSAVSLLVLGLTGYYQVPLIQRHGYRFWRYTHLATGLLVLVFVGYHMIQDGPDFFFIKEQLPEWMNQATKGWATK